MYWEGIEPMKVQPPAARPRPGASDMRATEKTIATKNRASFALECTGLAIRRIQPTCSPQAERRSIKVAQQHRKDHGAQVAPVAAGPFGQCTRYIGTRARCD